MSVKNFTIYGLIDPRDQRIHYVGISRSYARRIRAHLGRATIGRGGDTPAGRAWFASLAADHAVPSVVVLQVVETNYAGALAVERQWVDLLLATGAPLVTIGAKNGHTSPRRLAKYAA